MRAIRENQVVIVCGETGSGKTTQLPKICLELGRGMTGMIGHTQPRRIAARTVAARIASELNSPLGHAVGYKVRFSDKVGSETYVKLMTDGILLAETQGDLPCWPTIRSLLMRRTSAASISIFCSAISSSCCPARPDLKLDHHFRHHQRATLFGPFRRCAGNRSIGRMYPVEMRYQPIGHESE